MVEPRNGGEVGRFVEPVPTLDPPTNPPRYRYYYVTEHQLELLQTSGRDKELFLLSASTAVGIFFTSLGTVFTLPDADPAFPWFLGFTIAAAAVALIFGLVGLRRRRKSSDILENVASQHSRTP